MSKTESDLHYQIANLSLKDSDLVILKSNRILSTDGMAHMAALMVDMLPAGVKFVVLDASVDISVLRADQTVEAMPVSATLQ